MSRPTTLRIEPSALLHNLAQIKHFAPNKKVIAMVKANAYGCGVHAVVPVLEGKVDAFGVACLEEALVIHKMGSRTHCILFQGVFGADEYKLASQYQLGCVLHEPRQLQWLLDTPLATPIKVWIKVNTGMNRLGFKPTDIQKVLNAVQRCSWVDKDIGLMTHLACADQPDRSENSQQLALFEGISTAGFTQRSIVNSAGIISFPHAHADVIRPGIMLYGVSPFANQTGPDLGLIPVMRFVSEITAVYENPPLSPVGYGGTWKSNTSSRIGIVTAGYGDGYPRHIAENTPVWVQGKKVNIVGRVSMDMLAIDLTEHSDIRPGAPVELWGTHILVEQIAQAASTSAYELLCQITERVRSQY